MNKELLGKICDAWNLGQPHNLVSVTEGVLNKNYILTTTTGTFFIKSVRDKKQSIIGDIYKVEAYMKDQGIPSIVMIKNKYGDISIIEGSCMITVYPYIEETHRTKYSIKDYFALGEMLGKIHTAGSADVAQKLNIKEHIKELSIPKTKEVILKLEKYAAHILNKEIKDDEDQLFMKYISMKLEGLTTHPIPQIEYNSSLLHGDYNIKNILFGADGVVLGVCDWEKTVCGPKMYELIRAIMYGPLQERSSRSVEIELHYLDQVEAVLRGYTTAHIFSYEEIMFGYDLMAYSCFLSTWMENLYYDQSNDRANIFLKNQMNHMQTMHKSNLRAKIGELAKTLLK